VRVWDGDDAIGAYIWSGYLLGGLVRGWVVCRCGFVNMVLRGGGGMEVV
jgi:hypothetical protein